MRFKLMLIVPYISSSAFERLHYIPLYVHITLCVFNCQKIFKFLQPSSYFEECCHKDSCTLLSHCFKHMCVCVCVIELVDNLLFLCLILLRNYFFIEVIHFTLLLAMHGDSSFYFFTNTLSTIFILNCICLIDCLNVYMCSTWLPGAQGF